MTALMQPLLDEHRHLLPRIEEFRRDADRVGDVPHDELVGIVDDAHEFLDAHLLPHASAEDRVLYPVVGRLLGNRRATATMSRDHAAIAELAHELAALRREVHDREADTELVLALRRVLYGLYQLVTVHLAKEEQVYVPLLENGLSADEAEMLFADMHAAAEIHGTGTHAA